VSTPVTLGLVPDMHTLRPPAPSLPLLMTTMAETARLVVLLPCQCGRQSLPQARLQPTIGRCCMRIKWRRHMVLGLSRAARSRGLRMAEWPAAVGGQQPRCWPLRRSRMSSGPGWRRREVQQAGGGAGEARCQDSQVTAPQLQQDSNSRSFASTRAAALVGSWARDLRPHQSDG
jgi:hypothetical protein